MNTIPDRYQAIIEKIRITEQKFSRPANSVQLLPVSKKHPSSAIESLLSHCNCFGESYVQEALSKISSLNDKQVYWHFIGPIQSNKTRAIAENFAWVHSVDRLKAAQRLNNQRPTEMGALNICLQLNIDQEESKSGFSEDEINTVINDIMGLENINLRGFMVIPKPQESFEKQRQTFRRVNDLFKYYQQQFPSLDTLSMGMSNDLEAAIAEGATIVRIGTDIFGSRN